MKFCFALILILLFSSAAGGREIPVLDSLLRAKRCADQNACSYTWTLSSRAYRAFEMAQKRIGPRDTRYMLVGIEFTDESQPKIWFPGNKEYVVIQLTESAMRNETQALFQLGHEVFHVVSPTPKGVNILEEGLATEFSLDFTRAMGQKIKDSYVRSRNYRAALEAVRCLRKFEPKLNQRLARLRKQGARLGTVAAAKLRQTLSQAPAPLVNALSRHFDDIGRVRADLRAHCK